jgi:hypothetical protein
VWLCEEAESCGMRAVRHNWFRGHCSKRSACPSASV